MHHLASSGMRENFSLLVVWAFSEEGRLQGLTSHPPPSAGVSASAGSSVMAGSLLSRTNPAQEGSPPAAEDGRLAHMSKEQYCLILGLKDLKQSRKDGHIYTQTQTSVATQGYKR